MDRPEPTRHRPHSGRPLRGPLRGLPSALLALAVLALSPGLGLLVGSVSAPPPGAVAPRAAFGLLLAQDPTGQWNDARVRALVARGVQARQDVLLDPDFTTYSSQARGYLYFFVDREDRPEATLVKTDQIALEVYWRTPGLTKQIIVGLRDQKELPTNIRYHMDHLTVVQDDFGDVIRMGDGDEVSSVIHPLAPGAAANYDFRLSDSITITLPGPDEPVRVYGVEVRPRFPDQPGFVGTVFLDRTTGSVVRMNFTFTPASYVDPYLDYIRISLDNGLWDGKYWLPYRQHAELRREIPGLDMPVGSVIRGRWEVSDYVFNPPLPVELFSGRPVTAVPEATRQAFPFEEELYAQIDEEGLLPAPSMEEIRRQAAEMVGQQLLSGLRPTRLYLPSVSQTVRATRTEGIFVGAGVSLRPRESMDLRFHGGWAFSRGKPALSGEWRQQGRDSRTTLRGYLNRQNDVGPVQGASGVFNTFSVLAGHQDYTDPFFSSGFEIAHTRPLVGPLTLEGRLWWEAQRSGTTRFGAEDLPPVRPVEDQDQWGGALTARLRRGTDLDASLTGLSAFREGLGYATLSMDVRWTRERMVEGTSTAVRLRAGLNSPGAPPQSLALLGGRATVPGFPYRSFVGDRYWLMGAEASWNLLHPWLRIRALASAGQSSLAYTTLPDGWQDLSPMAVRGSVGAGLGVAWDVLRLDVHRGIGPGGEWQFILSVDPRFWPWL